MNVVSNILLVLFNCLLPMWLDQIDFKLQSQEQVSVGFSSWLWVLLKRKYSDSFQCLWSIWCRVLQKQSQRHTTVRKWEDGDILHKTSRSKLPDEWSWLWRRREHQTLWRCNRSWPVPASQTEITQTSRPKMQETSTQTPSLQRAVQSPPGLRCCVQIEENEDSRA